MLPLSFYPKSLPRTPAPVKQVTRIAPTVFCKSACSFCDFAIPPTPGQIVPPALSIDTLVAYRNTLQSSDYVKVRGGLELQEPFSYILALIRAVRRLYDGPLQVLSPVELIAIQEKEKRPINELLQRLAAEGATALGPGGGDSLTPLVETNRIRIKEWVAIQNIAGHVKLETTAMLLVHQNMFNENGLTPFIETLSEIQHIDRLEIKPLRSRGTAVAYLDPPHTLMLASIVTQLRKSFPNTHLIINTRTLTEDARYLLTAAGISEFYQTHKEITP